MLGMVVPLPIATEWMAFAGSHRRETEPTNPDRGGPTRQGRRINTTCPKLVTRLRNSAFSSSSGLLVATKERQMQRRRCHIPQILEYPDR